MEYMYSISDACPLDCNKEEEKLIEIIIELKNYFRDYVGDFCIIKDEKDDYMLRVEDTWSADGFADTFGLDDDKEIEATMLEYAGGECGILCKNGIFASFDSDSETVTVYADYPLTTPPDVINKFEEITSQYYEEQKEKYKRNKEIGTEFTNDEHGHLIKADSLEKLCGDIVSVAVLEGEVIAYVSEYGRRNTRDGIRVYIHKDCEGYYVAYIGDTKETPPFIRNDTKTLVNVLIYDLLVYLPVSENNNKYFLRIMK